MKIFLAVLALAGVAACGAPAAPPTRATLHVEGAWASPTPGGVDVSAGYMTIINNSGADDRLISASSPRARQVALHEMRMAGAVMEMRPVAALAVPRGQRVELTPSGVHLMFEGVQQSFLEGETIPVQLTFARAGVIDVTMRVQRTATPHLDR